MQGTLREFEDWLEDSIPEAVMIAYEKALSKLEECLPYEDTLVSIKQLLSVITLKVKLWLSWCSGAPYQVFVNICMQSGVICVYSHPPSY